MFNLTLIREIKLSRDSIFIISKITEFNNVTFRQVCYQIVLTLPKMLTEEPKFRGNKDWETNTMRMKKDESRGEILSMTVLMSSRKQCLIKKTYVGGGTVINEKNMKKQDSQLQHVSFDTNQLQNKFWGSWEMLDVDWALDVLRHYV